MEVIANKSNDMKMNKITIGLALAVGMFTSCENQDISFDDFEYQTVYFANQYPVRTIELGDDMFVDNSIDNEHKFEIKATIGGLYTNKQNVEIDYVVDETLLENLYFGEGAKGQILPMPANYYQLASEKLVIPMDATSGGVVVQLTDAFFADPLALANNYVIPLVMKSVQGADSILQGEALVPDPVRVIDSNWSIKPRDFVLYAVKYVNPWHGNYLRRGADQIADANGAATTSVRRQQYVENDEVVKISTNSLTAATLPLTIKDNAGKTVNFNLTLNFNEDGTCAVSGSTSAYEVSGTGKFVKDGEKKSMGGYDRNALYLDYSVDFKTLNLKYATKDTLVVRDRAVAPEYFTVVKK